MENYCKIIKDNGLKLTPRRKSIVRLFIRRDRHLTPEEVWRALRKQFKRCGLSGVYRNLESLTECGVLTKIQKFDRNRYYGLCGAHADSHHHHIVCVKCGRVGSVEECGLQHKKTVKGFKVLSHFNQRTASVSSAREKTDESILSALFFLRFRRSGLRTGKDEGDRFHRPPCLFHRADRQG